MLAETHELCPTVTYGWADQAYAGELVEWATTLLGITLVIVKRPPNQKGFVILAQMGCGTKYRVVEPLPTLEQGFRAAAQEQ